MRPPDNVLQVFREFRCLCLRYSVDRATDTDNTGTKAPIDEPQGNTTSSAFGFIIKTLADGVVASTKVCPTSTPNYSVKSQLGSISAKVPNCPADIENSATTSLSGGNTTAVINEPLTEGVDFC